jgi:hypothetical protein
VRLHLLAAETAAHPQALHRHCVRVDPEDVADDVLGLGGVLGARLDEDLAALVDHRERAVGLQIEVLLARELELAGEHMRRSLEAGLDVASRHGGLATLEAVRRDGFLDVDQRGQRLGLDLDRLRAQPGGFQRLAEHPADRVSDIANLVGEEGVVVLDASVVDSGHVFFGEDADHAWDVVRRLGVELRDPRMRMRDRDRPSVQAVLGAVHQVVGIERVPGDVEGGGLVWVLLTDDRVVGALAERAHQDSFPNLRSDWRNIALR